MTITQQQKDEIKRKHDEVAEFCARECIGTVIDVLGEDMVRDNQGIYDCISDMLSYEPNLTQRVLNGLKKALEVK